MNRIRIAILNADPSLLAGISPERFESIEDPTKADAIVLAFEDWGSILFTAVEWLTRRPSVLLFLIGPSQGAEAIVNAMCLGVHQVLDNPADLATALEWSWTLRQAPLSMIFSPAKDTYLVAWDDTNGIRGRFLASDGGLSEVFPIGPTSGKPAAPAVELDPSGDFLVSCPTPKRVARA